MASLFHYSKAVCRRIPRSLVDQALRMDDSDQPIDYDHACKEHERYMATLKSLGLQVIVLDADETLPDCVFVEDPAVIVQNTALITNPGHETRRAETKLMKETLEKLDMKVHVMTEPARLDGGDVLFTGKEFFVGLSRRTNEQGIQALRETFAGYPVHAIKVFDATLHLKSMMSMAGDNIIAVGQSKSASQAIDEIQNKAKQKYEILRVEQDPMANCLWINGNLIYRSSEEFPGIKNAFSSLRCPKLELSNTELSKDPKKCPKTGPEDKWPSG
eukprot:gene19241-21169_t